jgi:pimeloyl-ACP methyl ester carboxylesterase
MDDADDVVRLPDGRDAQLWEGGQPDGPAVFFVHGCPDCRLAARTGDAAARRAGLRLVAVNRPGYGRSTAHDFFHSSVAEDIVAVADRLGIGRFALVGMSVGGPYAVAVAARHPDRVRALAVVASPAMAPDLDPPWHRDDLTPEKQAFFAELAGRPLEESVAMMRPGLEDYVAQLVPDDPDDQALVERWLEGMPGDDVRLLSAMPTADVAEQVREGLVSTAGYLRDAAVTFRRWDFRPGDVECPTWLWYGERDDNAPPRNGRWFAECIPGATLTLRPTTHLATLVVHWDEILAALVNGSEQVHDEQP